MVWGVGAWGQANMLRGVCTVELQGGAIRVAGSLYMDRWERDILVERGRLGGAMSFGRRLGRAMIGLGEFCPRWVQLSRIGSKMESL